MKTLITSVLCVPALAGWAQAAEPEVKGDLVLPAQAVAFGPFARDAAAPAPEWLRRVPETLEIGGRQAAGRPAAFDKNRGLDGAPFCGAQPGGTAWVYLAFTAAAAGPVTFGFGADWWYEAYLDGQVISETLSRGDQGNGASPPSIRDFTATVDAAQGDHVLAVRLVRGSASAMLAVGGPQDLRDPSIRTVAMPAMPATVTKAGYREGPPAGKKWKLVWNDEFDGTTVDTGKWMVVSQGAWGWPGMKTKEEKNNLCLDGKGALVLKLTQDADGTVRYAKGMQSKFNKAYGYFETRVQFSRQPGWWTAVWLSGIPYDCGVDAFLHAQEFDIFEDFNKPKKQNDISQCYHCSVDLGHISGDQGNLKGVGDGTMISRNRLGRTSSGQKNILEEYDGWHTVGFQWTPLEHIFYVDGQETLRQTYRDVPVTTVPQHVRITSEFRIPAGKDDKPFYGRLEEAVFPDQLVVDYVRVYEEDLGGTRPPSVTLFHDGKAEYREGEPVTFDVTAQADGGGVEKIMLFSMGRLRAEQTVNAATAKTSFSLSNLFPDAENTIIAMAQDKGGRIGQSAMLKVKLITGKEYTGKAYQGKPQQIPGRLVPGYYDEGGNGVAFRADRHGQAREDLPFRNTELSLSTDANAVPVGRENARWITYQVSVEEAGTYEIELFMNRPDYQRDFARSQPERQEPVTLEIAGGNGALAQWPVSTHWDSGPGFRQPAKSLGKRTVTLAAGEQKIVLRFHLEEPHTYFCGAGFNRAQ
jgi:beta-glucanase (GH16 family)